jgi:hypothetical protein
MKRFLASLAIFSLVALAGHSVVAAGLLPLLGVGGGATGGGGGPIMTPTSTPLVSAYFDQNQPFGLTNNALKPNGGTGGAMFLPTDVAKSTAFYGEMQIDAALAFGSSAEVAPFAGMLMTANAGLPAFTYQRNFAGQSGTQFWLGAGPQITINMSAAAGSGYFTGFFPFTLKNSALEVVDRSKDAPFEALPSELGEEAFDGVEPGAGGRREVERHRGGSASQVSTWGCLWAA